MTASRPFAAAALAVTLSACDGQTTDGQRALEEALAKALPDRAVTAAAAWPEGSLEVEGHFTVEDGGQRWHLEVSRLARVRADGAIRVRETRRWRATERPTEADLREEDRWDRFEAVSDGRVWVTRRGEGPWIARDVTDGHHLETLRRVRDWLPELLTAFGAGLGRAPSAEPPLTLAGRTLAWQRVTPVSGGAAPSMTPEALRGLRDHDDRWPAWFGATHRVERASGKVAVLTDALPGRVEAAGEAVLGELEVGGTAEVSGRRLSFSASARQTAGPLPPEETFALPSSWLPADRPRVWPMIREVLGDRLAPWAGGKEAPEPEEPADAPAD
jgi:hypothetical protein